MCHASGRSATDSRKCCFRCLFKSCKSFIIYFASELYKSDRDQHDCRWTNALGNHPCCIWFPKIASRTHQMQASSDVCRLNLPAGCCCKPRAPIRNTAPIGCGTGMAVCPTTSRERFSWLGVYAAEHIQSSTSPQTLIISNGLSTIFRSSKCQVRWGPDIQPFRARRLKTLLL